MEREEKRRFLEQKKALWWGPCRYVLIRLSASGAESRQLYVYIYVSLSVRAVFEVVHSRFMPHCSVAGYNVARAHFRPIDAARDQSQSLITAATFLPVLPGPVPQSPRTGLEVVLHFIADQPE